MATDEEYKLIRDGFMLAGLIGGDEVLSGSDLALGHTILRSIHVPSLIAQKLTEMQIGPCNAEPPCAIPQKTIVTITFAEKSATLSAKHGWH